MQPLKNKKAQITVFMIVGIILMFSSALMFYIRGQITEAVSEDFIPAVEEVPLEAQPVKVFVENCLKKSGTDALVQAGLHAGYIDPKDEELSGTYFLTGIAPTESDALAVFESDNAIIPYWWYLKSPNTCSGNCVLSTNRPALSKSGDISSLSSDSSSLSSDSSIESQLDRHIERNLKVCLDNFRGFAEQGFKITELGPVRSDARVAEKEILLLLEYPLRVEKDNRKTDITKFFVKLDLNLKKIYSLATDITNFEINDFFLELHTMNLISAYSWPASMDKIPPIADFTLSVSDRKIWTRVDTQQKIESNILTVGIPMLRLFPSMNYRQFLMIKQNKKGGYEYDNIGQGMVDKTILIINNSESYADYSVDFSYLDWWPIYLNINDQEVLAPESVQSSDLLSFIGMNDYRFWYDISFPVLVTIRDPSAFEGRGYSFRFALEGNIRDNNHTSETYMSLANDTGKKLACNLNQRNSAPIRIEVRDSMTRAPVVNARVDFVLGNEACVVGFTELDENNKSVLTAAFPVGWGALRVTNEKYLEYTVPFVTVAGKSDEEEEQVRQMVELMPYRFINASVFVKVLSFDKAAASYVLPAGAVPAPLSPQNEKAIVMFERKDDELLSEFKTFLGVENSTSTGILRIVPGDYEVRAFIVYDNENVPIRIPKETITYEIPFSEDVSIDFNETLFKQYQEGGVIFDNETGYLRVTQDNLFNSNKVVFYLLKFPPPITHSESMKSLPGLEQMTKVKEMTGLYRNQVEPDWLR
jgi:hypothetical protein